MIYSVLIGLQTILCAMFYIQAVRENKIAEVFLICLTYFCEGGHFTLVPTICRKLYGKEGSRIFGWAFSFIGIASLLMIGMLETFFDVIGYDGFLLLFGGFGIGALLLLLFVFQEEVVVLK